MKAYLDSTERHLTWDEAFPDIADIFTSDGGNAEPMSHIFLHESDLHLGTPDEQYAGSLRTALHDGRGFKSDTNSHATNRAVVLRTYLREIRHRPDAPWLIMYSGGGINAVKRAEMSESLSLCLDGYPIARIRAIEDKIDRDVVDNKDRFADFILQFLAALTNLDSSDPNIELANERLRKQGFLALRVLIEAWAMNNGAAVINHNGVTINAPVKPEQWFGSFNQIVSKEAAHNIAVNLVAAHVSTEVEAFLLDVAMSKSVSRQAVAKLAVAFCVSMPTI